MQEASTALDPTAMLTSLVVGIISGVVTSAVIYGFVQLFRQVVLPWYRNFMYRGLDLRGAWTAQIAGTAQRSTFEILQHADELTGTATFVPNEGFESFGIRTFSIEGFVRERFVLLTLSNIDRTRLGIATYLLQVTGDGRTMEGYGSSYSVTSSSIGNYACNLSRQEPPSLEEASD